METPEKLDFQDYFKDGILVTNAKIVQRSCK